MAVFSNIDTLIAAKVLIFSKAVSDIVFIKFNFFGIEAPIIVAWLVFASIYCSIALKGKHFLSLPIAWRLIIGGSKSKAGDISHFQALATAVSGTIGIGNIGGVAIAISLGGPGVVFWMVVGGILGMATKFVECTLAVIYRKQENGTIIGGPMLYLEQGFKRYGYPNLGWFLGKFYAVVMVVACFGVGNMFQANQVFVQLVHTSNNLLFLPGWLVGLILAVLVGGTLFGGIKSIVKVTEKLVPIMAGIYLVACIILLLINIDVLGQAILLIVTQAFNFKAASVGGGVAVAIGLQRAFFSNEAGVGSAAIAHAAAKTDRPLDQGRVAAFEPLIDTVIVCTLTALVIVVSTIKYPNILTADLAGVELTSQAFSSSFWGFDYVLSLVVVLFAFSTMIAWSYYGLKCWNYIVGFSKLKQIIFQITFCCFIIIGCIAKIDAIVLLADAGLFILCIPNVLAIYFLLRDVRDLC